MSIYKHQAIATGQQEVTTITYTPPKRYRDDPKADWIKGSPP